MANHPYVSNQTHVKVVLDKLRNNFPAVVNSRTLKKLGIASNHESRFIAMLQFLKIIGENGAGSENAKEAFLQHEDSKFQPKFQIIIKEAYSDIFDTHGDKAWSLSDDEKIGYFRAADATSKDTARRQARVFTILGEYCGAINPRTDAVAKQPIKPSVGKDVSTISNRKKNKKDNSKAGGHGSTSDVSLTVRLEVNLPSNADKDTYDNIFKSLKEHIING